MGTRPDLLRQPRQPGCCSRLPRCRERSVGARTPGQRRREGTWTRDGGAPMRRGLTWFVACVACTGTSSYAPIQPYAPTKPAAPVHPAASGLPADAPAGFDGLPNGMVDVATFRADQAAFEKQEVVSSGLGPLYNADNCRDCHENPVVGGGSPVTVLRGGHRDAQGKFVFPAVP